MVPVPGSQILGSTLKQIEMVLIHPSIMSSKSRHVDPASMTFDFFLAVCKIGPYLKHL